MESVPDGKRVGDRIDKATCQDVQAVTSTDIDLDAWRRAIREETFGNYHYEMGVALERTDSPDAAQAAYERAIAIKPGHAASHMRLISLLEKHGDPEAARAKALRLIPNFAERAIEERSAETMRAGELDEAAKLLASLPGASLRAATLWTDLCHLNRLRGRTAEAAVCIDRALKQQPHLLEARREKGLLDRATGNIASALPHLQAVHIELEFDLEVAWNLAYVYQACLEFDRALSVTAPYCSSAPSQSLLLNLMHVLTLHSLRRYDDALSAFRCIPEVTNKSYPDRGWLLPYEGLILQAAGRREEAVIRYREAVEECPENQKPMARSYLGLGLEGCGDLRAALEQHEAVAASGLKTAMVLSNHALTLLASGRTVEAEALLVESLRCEDAYLIPLQGHQRSWATQTLKDCYASLAAR